MEKNPYAPPASSLDGSLAMSGSGDDEHTEYRDLGRLATLVSWLLLFGVVLSVIGAGSSLMQLKLLSSPHITQAQAAANNMREHLINMLRLLVYFVTIGFFGRWVYLAHRNLLELGARYLKFRPGWAVGSFFVPIVNLWMPFQAMRDLFRASHNPRQWQLEDTPAVLVFWWVLWIVVGQIDNVVLRQALHARTTAQLDDLTHLRLGAQLLYVPLGLLARYIVLRVSRAQSQSYASLAPGADPQPTDAMPA